MYDVIALRSVFRFFVVAIFLGCLQQGTAAPASKCVGGTCADGYTGCGCDVSCCERRMRGNQSSSTYSVPVQGVGATQGADEEAKRKVQQEADRLAREQEAKRLAAEKQRKFIEERNKHTEQLKSAAGTGSFGLKGVDQADAGLRGLDKQIERDLGGKQAAWKQLHCAASIIGSALTALKGDDGEEFTYLAGEAEKALNGATLGVECSGAEPFPEVNGRKADLPKVRIAEERILERAKEIAKRLPPKPDVALEQKLAPPPAGEDDLARLRRQQLELNRIQERKYDRTSQEAINREQRAKKELTQLIVDAQKIEKGDLSVSLLEEAPVGKSRPPALSPRKVP